uniref:Katanin p80 WD40 repeat-containing subunit B1 homolog isoform X1 n=1 Tax=Tanacetum cinerariifolium TaxID=118510 RepID=A0A6L2KPF2_TANCI|nr:katanin p80 WD40 repeat-containing subunit B1 homolog isoform X1 [Tanacetum cinerariifolium]
MKSEIVEKLSPMEILLLRQYRKPWLWKVYSSINTERMIASEKKSSVSRKLHPSVCKNQPSRWKVIRDERRRLEEEGAVVAVNADDDAAEEEETAAAAHAKNNKKMSKRVKRSAEKVFEEKSHEEKMNMVVCYQSRVGHGRLDAASTRVFDYEHHDILLLCFLTWLSIAQDQTFLTNGGGRHRDIPNMCGSDRGKKRGVDKSIVLTELEFLCGITSFERFNTNDNERSKFVHYSRDIREMGLSQADGHDLEDVGITMNKGDDDYSEEDEVMIQKRHGDYDSEDIDDMETDEEEPVRNIRQMGGFHLFSDVAKYDRTNNRLEERSGDIKPNEGMNTQPVRDNANIFQSFNSYAKAVLGNKSVDVSYDFIPDERCVWIDLVGLPLASWALEVYKKLRGRWGCSVFTDMVNDGPLSHRKAPNIESTKDKSMTDSLEWKDDKGLSLDGGPEHEEPLDIDNCDSVSFKDDNNDSDSSSEMPSTSRLMREADVRRDCMEKNLDDDVEKDIEDCSKNITEKCGVVNNNMSNNMESEILEDKFDGDRHIDTIKDNADVNPSTNVYLDVNQNTNIPEVVEDLSSLNRSSDKAERLAHHNNGLDDHDISLRNELLHQHKCQVGTTKAAVNDSSIVSPSTPPGTVLNLAEESCSTWLDYVGPLITDELDFEKRWSYRDPDGNVQGSFSHAQLRSLPSAPATSKRSYTKSQPTQRVSSFNRVDVAPVIVPRNNLRPEQALDSMGEGIYGRITPTMPVSDVSDNESSRVADRNTFTSMKSSDFEIPAKGPNIEDDKYVVSGRPVHNVVTKLQPSFPTIEIRKSAYLPHC